MEIWPNTPFVPVMLVLRTDELYLLDSLGGHSVGKTDRPQTPFWGLEGLRKGVDPEKGRRRHNTGFPQL